MAVTTTVTSDDAALRGTNRQIKTAAFALSGTYATGGFAISASDFAMTAIDDVIACYIDGANYSCYYDVSAGKVVLQQSGVLTGIVTDDDSATTNGTDVFITTIDAGVAGLPIAYLESTNANNADATYAIGASGPVIIVNDNDTPASDELYFDEDATSADSRFLHDLAIAQDVFLVATDGRFVRVAYDASASTNGVACHFDDDAANPEDRMLFVSPTDADGSYTTDDAVGLARDLAEVPSGQTVSGTAIITVKGR